MLKPVMPSMCVSQYHQYLFCIVLAFALDNSQPASHVTNAVFAAPIFIPLGKTRGRKGAHVIFYTLKDMIIVAE